MAEMKDSGVAWINTIPKEWKLKKSSMHLKIEMKITIQ